MDKPTPIEADQHRIGEEFRDAQFGKGGFRHRFGRGGQSWNFQAGLDLDEKLKIRSDRPNGCDDFPQRRHVLAIRRCESLVPPCVKRAGLRPSDVEGLQLRQGAITNQGKRGQSLAPDPASI